MRGGSNTPYPRPYEISPMKLAFVFFAYFPRGGLTRDALAIARACKSRRHEVRFYAATCRGDIARSEFAIRLLPARAFTNHGKNRKFVRALPGAVAEFAPDLIVGFNKMPNLDIYYAADICLAEKYHTRAWWHSATPRARHFLAMEQAVFSPRADTEILMISAPQKRLYQTHYGTPENRITLLPPGIARDRIAGDDAAVRRDRVRAEWRLRADEKLLLCVGSGFRTKGLDRSLRALAALPEPARLLIIGEDKIAAHQKLARDLGVGARAHFLRGRDDVKDFLIAADALLHPARYENTGTVLLEAMVAGTPVIATDVCGYAEYIKAYDMGVVLPSPFSHNDFMRALKNLLGADPAPYRERGRRFAATADIYDMPLHAARLLEKMAATIAAREPPRRTL